MLIDLIGDREEIVRGADLGEQRDLRGRGHVAGRVVRGVDDEHARARRGARVAQGLLVDAEARRLECDDTGDGARCDTREAATKETISSSARGGACSSAKEGARRGAEEEGLAGKVYDPVWQAARP